MIDLCKYKDLFGLPNTGLRQYRIFDIAIYDTVIVIICAWIISWVFQTPFWQTLIVIFMAGIVAHRLFCVRTGLDKKIFPRIK